MTRPKPDPNSDDNRAHANPATRDNCQRCGGSGKETINGQTHDCRTCGGSGKK